MRRGLVALALILMVSGCSAPRFNSISLWVGIRVPMPGSPIELGLDLDLQDSTAHQEKLRSMDLYAEIWKKAGKEKQDVK